VERERYLDAAYRLDDLQLVVDGLVGDGGEDRTSGDISLPAAIFVECSGGGGENAHGGKFFGFGAIQCDISTHVRHFCSLFSVVPSAVS